MIITRYLVRQVLVTTGAASFILLAVAVLGRLLKYLAQASQGELDPGVLFLLMGYRVPDFLQLILPLALLLGILLAYGRMYAESEMTVLIACGVTDRQLMQLTQAAAAVVLMATALLSLWLTPQGLVQAGRLLEAQKNLSEFDVMVPGQFQNLSRGARTTYAERISGGRLSGVFMYDAVGNRVIVAREAVPIEDGEGNRFVLFREGMVSEGLGGSEGYALTRFDELGVSVPPRNLAFDMAAEEQAATNLDLWRDGSASALAELQWRLSLIILIPVLTLLAVPLSRVSPRQGQFARLVPAILLYMLYFGLLLVSRDSVADGKLPPWLGLWWVHLLFAGLGWALYRRLLDPDNLRWRLGHT